MILMALKPHNDHSSRIIQFSTCIEFKWSKDTKGGPHHVSHPVKGVFDETGYSLKGVC
jgi:hypothetical protein